MEYYAIFILLVFFAVPSLGFRILGFFPLHSKSHHNVFAPIIHELAKNGHQVVYLTPIVPPFIHDNLDVRLITPYIDSFHYHLDLEKLGLVSFPQISHRISMMAISLQEEIYGHEEAQKIIHGSEKFDAVLLESYFVQEPASALFHKFGCPAIEVSSLGDCAWINELAGLPDNPSYQIDFKSFYTDKMTFWERVHNTYATLSTVLVSYYHLWSMQRIMDKYFNYTGWEDRPPLRKLLTNRSMILLNRDTALSYPYPLAPHMKSIGGLNIVPNNPLPQEIQKFMDESSNGVIYFSLGSNLKTCELSKGDFGKTFFDVFSQIPYKILMKWECDKKENLPANVKTFKWFPQQDVLAHKNCVLFITHGGYLGLTESVYHGVPVVGIPFFGDQLKNLALVESIGIGVKINRDNVSTESVSWAIREVVTNPRYKKEAVRRSRMMRDNRHKGLEDAVYWIEHAIRYPNSLTPRSAFMSAVEVYQIDIKLFIILFLFILYMLIKILFTGIMRISSAKKLKVA